MTISENQKVCGAIKDNDGYVLVKYLYDVHKFNY